jgi:hypothetical protein
MGEAKRPFGGDSAPVFLRITRLLKVECAAIYNAMAN